MGKLKCPKCKGHNIDLWSENEKEIHTTKLNLNPLKPFTVFDTKTTKKKQKSAAKVGLAIMTGGASRKIFGTDKGNTYYCRDCGNRWNGR